VADAPGHICADDGVTDMVGLAKTVTVDDAVPVHPLASVPVTEYVVVVVGDTVFDEPLPKPPDHV